MGDYKMLIFKKTIENYGNKTIKDIIENNIYAFINKSRYKFEYFNNNHYITVRDNDGYLWHIIEIEK